MVGGRDDGSITLAVVQFVIYAVCGFLGFAAWVGTVSGVATVGGYVGSHVRRWTLTLPFWGLLILASSFLALGAAHQLGRRKRVGAYLGSVAFAVGYVTNCLFARNLLVHAVVGALIGWILLTPLLLSWKRLTR